MKYNFTDDVRRALAEARNEALRLSHDYVGTEHVLLGLLRLPESRAAGVLEALGATPERVRSAVESMVRKGAAARPGRGPDLPYTSRAKKVLEFAMDDAKRTGAAYVDTEQLLAGLLREEKGIAAQVLNALGVTVDAMRAVVERIGDGAPAPKAAADASRPVWFLEIDASATAPIYEQIIAGVESAVATGRLEPGERLPTVRQLADELGLAPGTVARAYSELERRGVIETAGARGTFVAARSRSAAPATELEGLLRPVAVAAFHLGATADQLRGALERAMKGILRGLV